MMHLLPLFLAFSAAQAEPPKWPAVPGWASRSVEAPTTSPSTPVPPVAPRPPDTSRLRTVELIVQIPQDGTLMPIGRGQLQVSQGKLSVSRGKAVGSPAVSLGEAHHFAFVRGAKETQIYFDGNPFTSYPGTAPVPPSFFGTAAPTLLARAGYTRPLTAAQIKKNAEAGLRFGTTLLPDTATLTFEGQLGAFTPVPDPARIKPYRNALLAQEYTVLSLKEGHIKGLKPEVKVRVLRYGVWDGKKTSLENLKAGDRVRLKIQPLAADPVLEHEYQLDSLDVDVSATYYVETPADVKNP